MISYLIKVTFLDNFFFSGQIKTTFVIDVLYYDNRNIDMTDLAQLTANCLTPIFCRTTSTWPPGLEPARVGSGLTNINAVARLGFTKTEEYSLLR